MGEAVGKRFHVLPARSLFPFFARWTFFSGKKRSFSSNRESVGWLEGDETALNEKRLREWKGWSWRGTSPGRGEQMTVEGFIHSFMACVL